MDLTLDRFPQCLSVLRIKVPTNINLSKQVLLPTLAKLSHICEVQTVQLKQLLLWLTIHSLLQRTVMIFEPLGIRIPHEEVIVISHLLVLDVLEQLLVFGDEGNNLV